MATSTNSTDKCSCMALSPHASFTTISCRRETFQDWPYTYPTPQQLAEARFYYLGYENHCGIACFSCRVERHDHDALIDAQKQRTLLDWHAEGCDRRDKLRDTTERSVVAAPSPQEQRKRKNTAFVGDQIDRRGSIKASEPFLKLSSRLDSFQAWNIRTFSPQQLALAGFYRCTGHRDSKALMCFCCRNCVIFDNTGGLRTDKEAKKELLEHHMEGCLYAEWLRDMLAAEEEKHAMEAHHTYLIEQISRIRKDVESTAGRLSMFQAAL